MKIRAWLCLYNLLRAQVECRCRAQETRMGCCQQNCSWLQGHDGSLFSPMSHHCLDPMNCAFPSVSACLFRNTGAGPGTLGINATKANVCNYFSLACGLWDQRWWNTMCLMYFVMNKCMHIMWFSLRENRLTTKLKATTSWFFTSLPTHLKLVCRLS